MLQLSPLKPLNLGGKIMEARALKTFRVGPKNQKIEDRRGFTPDCPGYRVLVEYDLSLDELMEAAHIEISYGTQDLAADIFRYANEGKIERHFELFEFPKRADYGRDGVDESFVRERLKFFGFRPATAVELICFGRHIREAYADEWFESKNIIALGSMATTTQVLRKSGWLRAEVAATYRHYPELICVAGRPTDQIKLSTTEKDRDGNWTNEVLFLGTPVR